jgi:signal peptide peptidase SppA
VHSIIQVYDTPGGTVDGTQAFANVIRQVGQIKPVITLADGVMASAGVWAGTAASQIYIADTTTSVGSIGVVSQHVDLSGRDAMAGVKRTEVFAGKYKRIASDTGPLTKAGLQSIQDTVDYTYGLFVQAVATHRGVSVDQVLSDMADGRMFIGEQAINAGLVDGVSTLDDLIVKLNQDRTRSSSSSRASGPTKRAGVAHVPTHSQGAAMPITREQLAAEAPDVLAAIQQEGASAERERIQSIEAQALPGHDKLISALKFDGKSTAGDAAMALLAAEKQTRNAAASALASDAPTPLPVAPAPAVEASGKPVLSRAEVDTQAKAYVKANPAVSYVEAVKHITQGA